MTAAPVLMISHDETLAERVSGIAAAAGAVLVRVSDDLDVRRAWAGASTVLVGADAGGRVQSLGLPGRRSVYLVGDDPGEVVRWSVPLGAMGLVLPAQSGTLTSVLEGVAGAGDAKAALVRVLGGSGGVGASTLAAALAQRAAKARRRAALVELDAHGGGVDLLFGAEDAPGWRWGDLSSAAGHIGSLSGQLPNVSGVDLLSVGSRRGAGARVSGLPGSTAVQAVLASLGRSHEVVVLDGAEAVTSPATVVVVVAAGVRSVLAARSMLESREFHDARLVVRRGPGWRLDADQVAEALGLACLGVIDHDKSLPRRLEVGDPPGRAAGRFAKQVDVILGALT